MRAFLAILVIAAVAVGGYSLYKHRQTTMETAQAPQQQVQDQTDQAPTAAPATDGKKVPFATFMAQANAPYQCTVHQFLSDMDNTETVFLNAGNVKGDYSVVAEGKTMQGSFLMTGGMQYLWMKGAATGYKIPASTISSSGSVSTTSGTYSWNATTIGDYDCQPWSPSPTAFSLPTGIKFTDISAMLKAQAH